MTLRSPKLILLENSIFSQKWENSSFVIQISPFIMKESKSYLYSISIKTSYFNHILTPPFWFKSLQTNYIRLLSQLLKSSNLQWLNHYICQLHFYPAMLQLDSALVHLIPKEVKLGVYMLASTMRYWILG